MAQHVQPAAKLTQSHGGASIDGGASTGENHPSNNLWIGNVVPDVTCSELKALFESYGEVLGVNSFPCRRYAFVYFKEIDDAIAARWCLEGHVLRGNPLQIDFAKPAKPCNSLWVARISPSVTKEELEKEFLKFGPIKEVRFLRDRNTAYIDYFRLEDATQALKIMNGKQIGGGQIRVDFNRSQSSRREQGLDGNECHFPSRYFASSEFQRTAEDSSPISGIVSSPFSCFSKPNRFISDVWDVSDSSQLQRDPKRSKFSTALPDRTENQGSLDEENSLNRTGASVSLPNVTIGGLGKIQSESNYIWRGIIAKGGMPVCRARCVPVGEGIDAYIPEVINFSARIELNLLRKEYDSATGFNVVYFLPDSEEDFASYTKFLTYLVSKGRAGVAQFDDGTTLFLVPPSDFMSNVLKVCGPERLYGVVLKFPEVASSSKSKICRLIQPHNRDPRRKTSLLTRYSVVPKKDMVLPENSKMPSEALAPMSSCQQNVFLPRISSMMEVEANVARGPNIDKGHWKHDRALDYNGQIVQRVGSMHEHTINLPSQGAIPPKSMASVITPQSGPVTLAPAMKYKQWSSHVILRGQVRSIDTSNPMPHTPLPSEVEHKHQSQQHLF